jgi:hypothetical protein
LPQVLGTFVSKMIRPDLSSDRRALAAPGGHALEHTIPKDQGVHQRGAEMNEKSGEQQERKRRVQRSQQRVERVAVRQDRWQMQRSGQRVQYSTAATVQLLAG